jgi:hypothetical protein
METLNRFYMARKSGTRRNRPTTDAMTVVLCPVITIILDATGNNVLAVTNNC